jgi:NADP-dependent 3-hydroxy acid dehydrogenase YdfG
MPGRGLDGRVAAITGASSGIGQATARRLAGEGAGVALLARRRDRIEELAGELDQSGTQARAYEVDVRDRDGLAEVAAAVGRDLGRVDCLVNNAGLMRLSHFETGLEDEWRTMIDTNLTGALAATAAFLPQLVDGGGDIVNVSSVAGRKARETGSVYSATKWGLNGWSEGLRQELLERDVRVTVVEPGAVATELSSHITDERALAGMRSRFAQIEVLQAEDVAAVIAFAVALPPRASLNEALIRPSKQAY